MVLKNRVTIEVVVKRVFFQDDGFIISSTEEGITIRGNTHHEGKVLEGEKLSLSGEWTEHPQHGRSFFFYEYQIKGNPSYFFLTKMCKGISKKSAREILQKVGNLDEVIEKNPRALLSISGIGEKKIKMITETYIKNKRYKELSALLSPVGVTNSRIIAIQEHFSNKKEDAVREIKKNPYILTRVANIGFRTADKIALMINGDNIGIERVENGVLYTITEYSKNTGNTFIDIEKLYEESKKNLDIEDTITIVQKDDEGSHEKQIDYRLTKDQFSIGLGRLLDSKAILALKGHRDKLSLRWVAKEEEYIASIIVNHGNTKREPLWNEQELEQKINEFQKGFVFGDDQIVAIRLANNDFPIMYIAGLAGSGKTTTSKAIMRLYEDRYGADTIHCCALSGVASTRTRDVTGYRSSTIHSLLRFNGSSFEYGEEKKLPYRLIVLDEASMVDVGLFASLMRAINFDRTTLICIGDNGQLKPIGMGSVFNDIITQELCKGATLTQIYRSSEEKMINVFATQYVREGRVPEGYRKNQYEDFFFYPVEIGDYWAKRKKLSKVQMKEIKEENNRKIAELVEEIARKYAYSLKYFDGKQINKYLREFQAITPVKEGMLGVHQLNRRLQKAINPYEYPMSLKIGNDVFKKRDKVIHLENTDMATVSKEGFIEAFKNKEVWKLVEMADGGTGDAKKRRVFNGEIGAIISIEKRDDNFFVPVYYPDAEGGYVAIYKDEDFENRIIQHGYCITIHKSQSAEYEHLVVPFSMSFAGMLSNDMTYTAMTRAKKSLHIVGEGYAFEFGCKKREDSKRNTVLGFLGENIKTMIQKRI